MKSVDHLTKEQIEKFKVITPEQAQKEIDQIYINKKLIEDRVAKIDLLTSDTVLIERMDYRERGSAIVANDKQMDLGGEDQFNPKRINKGRGFEQVIGISFLARVLKVSDVKDSEFNEHIKSKLKVGTYVVINQDTPVCPNLKDWDNEGKYDDLYKSIWLLLTTNIIMIDAENNKNCYYDLKAKGIEKRQEISVDRADSLIKDGSSVSTDISDTLADLRKGIFDDGEVRTSFKGLPTPKFHERG